MMMKIFIVLMATIAMFFNTGSCSVIRDQDSLLLGNERISKRSIKDNEEPNIKPAPLEESANDKENVVQPHIISRRAIRSDEYRQHDDLIMSIVPKAIFGERILRRFVQENVFRNFETTNNHVFKPQFRLRTSSIEKRPVQ